MGVVLRMRLGSSVLVSWLAVLCVIVDAGIVDKFKEFKDLGEKHLGKLTSKLKGGGEECKVIWEEHQQPHCSTEYVQVCDDTYDEQCTTEYVRQCSTEYEQQCTKECKIVTERRCDDDVCEPVTEVKCETEYANECSTKYEQSCSTVQEQECWNEPVQECSTVYDDHCWTENKQQCSTVPECNTIYDKQCDVTYKTVCNDAYSKSKRSVPDEPANTRSKRYAAEAAVVSGVGLGSLGGVSSGLGSLGGLG